MISRIYTFLKKIIYLGFHEFLWQLFLGGIIETEFISHVSVWKWW